MKVLQVSTGFDISFNGGIPNYVRNLSETLIKKNVDVTVLYSQDNGLDKNYSYKLINFKPILRPFHLSSVVENKDIKKLEKIIIEQSPDIIHIHMMIDLPLNFIKLALKYSKVIISLHDYSHICNRIVFVKRDGSICENSNQNIDCNLCIKQYETINNRYIRKICKIFDKHFQKDKIAPSDGHHQKYLISKQLFNSVDALIAVSNRVKEIYLNNGINNSNFIVNHIGSYTADETFRKQFIERPFLSKDQIIKFGFIGSLNYIKGVDIFFQLIDKSKHEFHIYGVVNDKIKERLKQYPNVFYHGKYFHEELADILKNIEIGLVLPIWEDNAPQVVFEFLNARIPIIGTKKGGLPDFINDSNGILFDNSKHDIDRIKHFINSDDIINFYNKIINNFSSTKSPTQHADEIIKLYDIVLSKNSVIV